MTASLTCRQVLTPPVQQISTRRRSTTSTAPPVTLQFTPRQRAWECGFSPDGQLLAVAYGAPDPVIRIFEFSVSSSGVWTLQATLSGIHEKTIRSVAFGPLSTTRLLASASFDGTVAIWEPEHQFGNATSGNSSASQDWISSAQLEGHETEVKCVRWNATGSLLATCGRDKSVWIWECFLPGTVGGGSLPEEQFECLSVLHGHEGDVKSVRFAPSHGAWGDGEEILLSASYDNTIKCWAEDAGDWYCVATLSGVHASTIWSLTLSPSGARLVAGSEDGAISIYKCYTHQERREHVSNDDDNNDNNNKNDSMGLWKCVGKLESAHGQATAVYCVDYAPAKVGHGRLVSSGGDNRIQILREMPNSSSDQPLFSCEVDVTTDHGDVNCVTWHPLDGSVLASTGDDGYVRIWNFQI